MEKIILKLLIILCAAHVSCNNASTVSGTRENSSLSQKNIQAWHTVSMAFSTGNLNGLDSVIAEDYIDHTPIGDIKGRDSVKANITRMKAIFKDVEMKIIKELADEEYGFFWMNFTGKRIGATGNLSTPFDMTTVQVVRFNNGMAVEHWEYIDRKQLMKMMQRHEGSNKDSVVGK